MTPHTEDCSNEEYEEDNMLASAGQILRYHWHRLDWSMKTWCFECILMQCNANINYHTIYITADMSEWRV